MVEQRKVRKSRKDLRPHKLEEYEPGATKEQFLKNLKKVASTPKYCPKNTTQKQ